VSVVLRKLYLLLAINVFILGEAAPVLPGPLGGIFRLNLSSLVTPLLSECFIGLRLRVPNEQGQLEVDVLLGDFAVVFSMHETEDVPPNLRAVFGLES